MANAWCINAYDCNGCLIQTLQNLDSACIGVGVQYTAPNPLDDKRLDYIKYTDKCWCVQCLSAENEILIYATNGVIKNLTLTNDDVNEAIKIKWNDIFGSNRAKTIVRYKTWSYPVSITDGTLAVEETTKNQYSSTPFSLSGVLDETTYYITAFAVDSNNVVIWTQQTTITTSFWWHPSANTLARYKLETDANDYSWNGRNLTNSWVLFTTLNTVKCASMTWSWFFYRNDNPITWSSPFTAVSWFYNTQNASSWQNAIAFWQWWWTNAFSIWIYPSTNKLMVWWWSNDRDTWLVIDKNKWYCVAMIHNSWTIKVYVNWTLIYTWTVNFNLYSNKTRIWCWVSTQNPDWDRFFWYLWDQVQETKAWSESDYLNFFNRTKRKYWL